MAEPTSTPPSPATRPELTPQFCLNTTALRDFLRLSRATVDDSISAHLNALLTPSRTNPFLPTTTASRALETPTSRSRQNIPAATCDEFQRRILFPSWRTREDVLVYCSRVVEAPEGSTMSQPAPVATASSIDTLSPTANGITPAISRNYWGKEQIVDERTDPYSGRDYSYTRETKKQMLSDVLHNEKSVESIVRARTWHVLGERCIGGAAREESWQDEWNRWQSASGR